VVTAYFLQRLLGTLPVLLLITLLVFVLLHAAPGDPATMLLGQDTTAADLAEAKKRWGLDQPVHVQYVKFVLSAAAGDFGKSFRFSAPVTEVIAQRLPATIELAVFSILIAVALALPLGVWSGSRPNSWIDNLGTSFGLFGISMPNFWLGIMLILLFSGTFHILPSAGRSTYGIAGPSQTGFYFLDSVLQGNRAALKDAFLHVLMPALALGVNMIGILMRITRSSILEAATEEYVVTARAKGLGNQTVLWRHIFRNALVPIVTIVGLEVGTLLSGSIIVETVFGWPGIGSLLITGVTARDYPLVTGLVLMYTLAFVTINLIIDALYAVIDPRIRF
jgi:peptide/nickel transport system permease protein